VSPQAGIWQYYGIPDPKGRAGIEHHAGVASTEDKNVVLMLESSDGQFNVTFYTSRSVIPDASLENVWFVKIRMHMDDQPASDYVMAGGDGNLRWGFVKYVGHIGRPDDKEAEFSADEFITRLKAAKTLRIGIPIEGKGFTFYTFPVAGLAWK
jgi:hypothetical protein